MKTLPLREFLTSISRGFRALQARASSVQYFHHDNYLCVGESCFAMLSVLNTLCSSILIRKAVRYFVIIVEGSNEKGNLANSAA